MIEVSPILGKQNTPCGHYDMADIRCDAITCKKIRISGGTWHVHRYLRIYSEPRFVRSDLIVMVKIRTVAKLYRGEK